MASVASNTQFGFGGFTKKNPFEISNPTTGGGGGLFSFGVPTGSFSGQSSSSNSSSTPSLFGTTTTSSMFGTTSQFSSRPTTNNSFTTTSPFGTFSSGGQTCSNSSTSSSFGTGPFATFRPTGGNLFTTTSQFGTSSCSTGQSTTTLPFGTAPFSVRPTNNSFTTPPQPFGGTGPFSTGPFTTAPPNPSTQPNNSWTTSPFGQTTSSVTTSPFTMGPPNPFSHAPFSIQQTSNSPTTLPCGTAPFSFPQPTNPLTTSPTRFPSTSFPFTSSMISTPATSPSNVSVFAPPFSASSIQGTRQEAYKQTAFDDPLDSSLARKPYKIRSISAMPCYEKKSHEELRLEDYTLTGKAGIASTTTTTTTPNSQPIFPQPVITPFSAPSFVPPASTTYITPNVYQPITQPVIAPFQKFNFQFPTSQTICNPSPNSTTDVLQDSTVVPVTSIPAMENNNQQQEVRDRDTLPIIKPFQYGISCLPVSTYENPKPAQKMPPVNVRQLSMGRRRVPIEKYKPNADEKRVPFFEELPAGIYRKGAGLIPRENPRSWVVLSCEEQRLETELNELSVSDDQSTDLCNKTEDSSSQVDECVPKTYFKHGDEDCSVKKNTGAIVSNDRKDPSILAMIPKLRSPEYYMEPSTEDLEQVELRRSGSCCKVKDFVIGRRNYGSIKFLGETDIRNLDVESIVQFSNKEVEVYKDEKDKPPVGQGLNKAAEITLLNIKCIDKSTGMHYIDGPRVDKLKKLLMRKAMKQGSEFISYDPVKGEWRFKVEHF